MHRVILADEAALASRLCYAEALLVAPPLLLICGGTCMVVHS